MAFRITPVVRRTELARAIRTSSEAFVARQAVVLKEAVERDIQRNIRAEFNTSRPADRRRSPGTPRLDTQVKARVTSTRFPIIVEVYVVGGAEAQRKVAALNYGARPHPIRPSGKWPNKANPDFVGLAWPGGKGFVVVKGPDGVEHPRHRASRFIERGMESAVRRFVSRFR